VPRAGGSWLSRGGVCGYLSKGTLANERQQLKVLAAHEAADLGRLLGAEHDGGCSDPRALARPTRQPTPAALANDSSRTRSTPLPLPRPRLRTDTDTDARTRG